MRELSGIIRNFLRIVVNWSISLVNDRSKQAARVVKQVRGISDSAKEPTQPPSQHSEGASATEQQSRAARAASRIDRAGANKWTQTMH